MTLSEELSWRGFVNQTTFKDITELDRQKRTFYFGVDPSAPSMTIGNLAAALMVRHFIDYGHKAVLLVGGATGLIGDPDGKAEERDLKSLEEIAANKAGITEQYKRIFNNEPFEIVDNYDWFKDLGYLQFLREVGKHVPMRQMLNREFVQQRLSESGAGISYAEFSYVLIQAYDFYHLSKEKDVSLQLCGSDQWGNSIAGVDLIRRLTGKEAHVWSTPLVINKATGKKFGKTEDGAIWLNEKLTSVFKFYQFWLNVDDEGVADYLKIYTLLPKEQIEAVMTEFEQDKARRAAQKCLAYEVTKLVHGEAKANATRQASEVLFGQAQANSLGSAEYDILKSELPTVEKHADDTVITLLVKAGVTVSNSEAQRLIQGGAVSVNGQKVTEDTEAQFNPGENLLRKGKNSFAIVTQK